MDQKLMKFYLLGLLKYLKSSLISGATILSAFLAPIGDSLFFVSILVVADFITGIIAAKNRGEQRTSAKMMNSVIKFSLYLGIIILAYLFDDLTFKVFKAQFFDHILTFFMSEEKVNVLYNFKFVAAVSFIIIIREFKSIDENWKTIFNWSFLDMATDMFKGITSFLSYVKDFKN